MINRIVYILGKPGVGKSSAIKHLTKLSTNLFSLNLGYIFRFLSKFNPILVTMLSNPTNLNYIPSLNLIAVNLVLNFRLMKNIDKILLVDGFPRYAEQLMAIRTCNTKQKQDFIYINVVNDNILLNRIKKRNKFESRVDDNEIVFFKRVNAFNLELENIKRFASKEHSWHEIIILNQTTINDIVNKIAKIINENE